MQPVLRQRVITALIMAGLFLAGVAFLPLPWLALIFGVLVSMGAWEWSRLAGWTAPLARGLYVLLIAGVLFALYNLSWAWPACGGRWHCCGYGDIQAVPYSGAPCPCAA